MKFGVVVFPGSNCDMDCYHVVKDIFDVPVEILWHKNVSIENIDCVIIPGGFSYGDYLRSGAIAKFSPLMNRIVQFAQQGGFVIGICNGFQILLESGLLPGAMLRNRDIHFICKYVYIKVEDNTIPFTSMYKKGDVLKIPIAHNEGNYYCDNRTLANLGKKGIVFRYCDKDGNVTENANPNGAVENIAGICNTNGNVLGMMPHPERASEEILGSEDGKKIFESIIYFIDNKLLKQDAK